MVSLAKARSMAKQPCDSSCHAAVPALLWLRGSVASPTSSVIHNSREYFMTFNKQCKSLLWWSGALSAALNRGALQVCWVGLWTSRAFRLLFFCIKTNTIQRGGGRVEYVSNFVCLASHSGVEPCGLFASKLSTIGGICGVWGLKA